MDNAELIQSVELNKESINSTAKGIINSVREDGLNPLKVVVQLKALQKVADVVTADLTDLAIAECDKYGKGEKVFGAKVEVKESGVKYDYSRSQTWLRLQAEIDNLKAKQKVIENAMKNACAEVPFIDTDSGEIIDTSAPRTSKTCVVVTF